MNSGFVSDTFEGYQNMPPQNMLILHKNCLEPKLTEKQQKQEKISPPICLKSGHKFSLVEVSPAPFPNQEKGKTLNHRRQHEEQGTNRTLTSFVCNPAVFSHIPLLNGL